MSRRQEQRALQAPPTERSLRVSRTPSLRVAAVAAGAALLPLALAPAALAAGEPARGAPTQDLVPATVVGVLLAVGAIAFGELHRRGRTGLLTYLAETSERISGFPGWVALPSLVA